MARITTPATQGAQNIGAVQLASDPRTRTQTVRAGDFGVQGRALQAAGKGIQTAAQGLDTFLADRSQKKQQALFLRTQRNLTSFVQDYENEYKSPAMSAEGVLVNANSALGERATDQWFKDSITTFDAKADEVRSSEEYQSLRPDDQLVIDRYLEGERQGFRANAALHLSNQANIELQAEFAANQTLKRDDAVRYAGQPGQANARLQGYIGLELQQARSNGQDADDPAVRVKIQTELDGVAQTSIDNILNSNDPNKVEKARIWLATNGSIDMAGQTFQLTADKRNDIEQLISSTEETGKVRVIGQAYHQRFGSDITGAIEALNADPSLTPDQKNAVEDRVRDLAGVQQAQLDRQRDEFYRNLSVRAGRGEPIGDAELNRLTGPQKQNIISMLQYAARSNPMVDNQDVREEWAGMSQPQRAQLSLTALNQAFRNSLTAETADKVLSDWTAAREQHRGDTNAAALRAAAADQQQLNSEQSRARTYFEKQLSDRVDALVDNKELKATQAAQIRSIARREFEERNIIERPMTEAETEALLNDTIVRSASGGYAAGISQDLYDEDGDPVGVTDLEKNAVISAIPETDRFDLMRWYRKSEDLSARDPVNIKKFSEWVMRPTSAGGANWLFMTIADVPPSELQKIQAKRPGISNIDAVSAYKYALLRRNSR